MTDHPELLTAISPIFWTASPVFWTKNPLNRHQFRLYMSDNLAYFYFDKMSSGSLSDCDATKQSILSTLEDDFAKYGPRPNHRLLLKTLFLDVGLMMLACGLSLLDFEATDELNLVNQGAVSEQFSTMNVSCKSPMQYAGHCTKNMSAETIGSGE